MFRGFNKNLRAGLEIKSKDFISSQEKLSYLKLVLKSPQIKAFSALRHELLLIVDTLVWTGLVNRPLTAFSFDKHLLF